MRNIPSALKAHLQEPVTTTCRLLKIVLKDGREFGLASLDRRVTYQGLDYEAINGFNPSAIASDTSFSIDNSEGFALVSGPLPGVTTEMVERGEMDDATWECYLVNYEDLTMGHILLDAGDLGEVRLVRDTVYIPELVSYAMRLRQTIGHVDSKTCRAVFGQDAMGQLGCGVDVSALWYPKDVLGAGEESTRVFSVDTIWPYTPEELVPGRIEWVTGDNVSARQYQIEQVVESDVDAVIYLLEPTPFPITSTDQLRLRPDCDKRFETCRDRWGNMINFKGENLIPLNDGNPGETPGSVV